MMMNHYIVSKAVINCRHTYLKLCLNRINIVHHKNKYYNYFSHNKVETYSSSTPTSSVSSLEKLYKKSLFIINNKQYQPINTVDNDVKLKMYALYKQIEDGPLNASSHSKPGFFDPIGRAKYEAWLSLGNLSKEEAMKSYTSIVNHMFNNNLPDIILPDDKNIGDHSSTQTPSSSSSSTATTVSKSSNDAYHDLKEIAFPNQIHRSFSDIVSKLDFTKVIIKDNGVQELILNRPNRGNAIHLPMWKELELIFDSIRASSNPSIRAVILSGADGKFCSGMDLSVFVELQKVAQSEVCEGRRREGLMKFIKFLQDVISGPETCGIPVIAAIAGPCIGGAVDLITACDMRYCTKDATFCVKETDLAIVADIGTLQRLPLLIGYQQSLELTYTGRTITGLEAQSLGLVLKCFDSEMDMMIHVREVADTIATKSPLTIRGVKQAMLYSRDHTVNDSLEQVKLWNSSCLFSDDLIEVMTSTMSKKPPVFKGH